ncbi:hypothetical protein PISMIDRAFT_112287 [Pisolithus microcarpus 441]|uniref:Helitron helicase-like domain-containing protein n=1 Tax=Pisolithus microcarpus 441 TaxID=765257 RepID=A0A0C9YSQ7_9AGAM|nr:hypothetical protein PISMIDRAFT_112287 [Pisolithus microcarpus 441]
MSVVSRKVRGSSGYKVCHRNEIRSLIRVYGTPALFITLNPHDLTNVLVGHFGGVEEQQWHIMTAYECAVFIASHPEAAALAFDEQIHAFFDIIVCFNKGEGLFGVCEAYYVTIEEQGHCQDWFSMVSEGVRGQGAMLGQKSGMSEFSTQPCILDLQSSGGRIYPGGYWN